MIELSFGLATLCALLSLGAFLDQARLAGLLFALAASLSIMKGVGILIGAQ